ncbi:MAG: hypothetical protein EBT84_04480, partial [Sphingomonadaceae bacterium]|nr:hypothetical protein [Sphingomonadaceae bacterium]
MDRWREPPEPRRIVRCAELHVGAGVREADATGRPMREIPAMRQTFCRTGLRGAVMVACAIAALPARAESTSWNFKLNNGGWVATGTWGPFPTDPAYQWKWVTSSTVSGGTSPHWAVRAQGV